MNLSKDELRALAHEMVARHLERRPPPGAVPRPTGPDGLGRLVGAEGSDGSDEPLPPQAQRVPPAAHAPQTEASHPSHVIIQVVGIDIDIYGDVEPGSCVIEPSVPCTHCGYCRSYGH